MILKPKYIKKLRIVLSSYKLLAKIVVLSGMKA
jgi:hypothetical protein